MSRNLLLERASRRLILGLSLIVALVAQTLAQNVFVTSAPISGDTITAAPPDNNNVSSGVTSFSLTYPIGVVVVLTAPATFNGEIFANWTLNGVAQAPGALNAQFNTGGGVMNAVAVYTTPNVAVTVSSINPASGVNVTAAPPDNGNQTGGTTTFVLNYPNLTTVTLTAPPGAGGNAFDHWVLGAAAQPQGQTQIKFALAGQVNAIAVYAAPTIVNVQSSNPNSGVVVTASPPDAANLTSGTTAFVLHYAPNEAVTLTAPASSGLNTFANWTINGAPQPAGQVQITFPASPAAPTTAVAVYQTPNYTITASAVGTHGVVNPNGVVGEMAGANQLFTATPNAGWMVKQWLLDGVGVQNGGLTFQLNRIVANHTLQVSFSVIIVFHPADTNKDGVMTIGEVTAYGAAWKRGTTWPNAPSPIPQSFITNAIMLWKSGEAYTNDPSKTAPNLWVPIAEAPALAKPAVTPQAHPASSISSATLQPDGWWLVNVTVSPAAGTRAYTLEENLPRGAQIKAISAGGVFDARGSIIRWGPFLDSAVRIFSYRIKATGSAVLAGSASFDGSDVKTTGDRSLGGKS